MGEKDIPVLKPEVLMALPNEPQPGIDAASAKMYEDTHKAIVKINLHNGRSSTGFVVGDGEHILSTANNIGESKEQTAIGQDGKHYKLEIEKMDDLSNLALYRIKNGSIPGTKALTIGDTTQINSDDRIWALSFPSSVATSKPYLSPGYIRGAEMPINLLAGMDPMFAQTLNGRLHALGLEKGAEASVFLMQAMIEARMHVEIGSGGSPVLNEKGEVIAVTSLTNGRQPANGETLASPAENATALLNGKGKFEYKYKAVGADWAETYRSHWQNDTNQALLETGVGALFAGVAYKGASRFPLVAGAGLGGYGLVKLTMDANNFMSSTDSADSWKYGLSTLADAGTAGGGIMMTIPRMRTYGLALAGLSLVGRSATDFIRNHWSIDERTRLEGDPKRPPFSLDKLLNGK